MTPELVAIADQMQAAAEETKAMLGHRDHDGFTWSIDGLFCGCGEMLFQGMGADAARKLQQERDSE